MVRKAAVAGKFYSGSPTILHQTAERFLSEAARWGNGGPRKPAPKAVIAPHAGYPYSGPIAASAYASLAQASDTVRRVVLLGPAHWVPVRYLAASSAEAFDTPLGRVPCDAEARDLALKLPQVAVSDEAHAPEHSLEVHLPFLQMIFASFSIAPFLVGYASPEEVARLLDTLWGGPETVVVVSSDLSHFEDYHSARRLDQQTTEAIESLRYVSEDRACGGRAINGLIHTALARGMSVKAVDVRNSGDTAGPRDSVVGYGAYLFWEKAQS
jgi:MEMO1 family protein